jgi:hypothetical protein
MLSMIFNSVVLMWILALVFAVICFRCLVYGTLAGTSAILRIVLTIVFAALAYFCWKQAVTGHASNAIDRFVLDSLADLKQFWHVIVNKIF